jgi:MerR family copper efflux transcriptional regulator
MTSPSITTDPLLKIGDVAERSGLSVKTIRYYEDIGLLTPTVERSPDSNYRLFRPAVFNRLSFIRRSQALGLTLQEIRDILEVHDQGHLPCGEVKQHLQAKVQEISDQIAQLEMLRSELEGILSGWQESPSPEQLAHTICPNLQL